MKSLTSFFKQCIAEVLTEPKPRKIKGLRSLVRQCIAEVIVEPDGRHVRVYGNPRKFKMSSLIKECTLEILKERVSEAFDPTSQGPNIPEENPYPALNAKMAKLEEGGDSWSRYEQGYKAGKADKAAGKPSQKSTDHVHGVGYNDGYNDRDSARPETVRKLFKEAPHGRYAQQAGATPFQTPQDYEETKTFQEIRDREDPKGFNHDLTLECVHCGRTQTCRCSKPKRLFKGVCESCAKVPIKEWSPEEDIISKVKKEVYSQLTRYDFRKLGDTPRDYMEYYLNGFVTVSLYISFDDRKAHIERYYDSEMVDNIPGHHIDKAIPIPPTYEPEFVQKLIKLCVGLKNRAQGDESIFGGIDDLQEQKSFKPTMAWKCPHCQKKANILLEIESPVDYVAYSDCNHCGKEISDPKMDRAIYEVVVKHYALK
jgi:hypothetical protein